MSTVGVRVVRPCVYLGRRREVDEVLEVDPLTASLLTHSGRCALDRPADDSAIVQKAVAAHNVRACKAVHQDPRPDLARQRAAGWIGR